jgi:hypothetical protein
MYDLHSVPKPLNIAILERDSPQQLDIDRRLLTRLSKSSIWKGVGLLFKYLFMVFLVPLYLLFYGLPKWLIQKTWPVVNKITRSTYQKLTYFYTKCARVIQKMFPTKQGIKRVMQWDKIKNGLRALRTRFQHIYLTCFNRIKTISSTCGSYLTHIFSYVKAISFKQKRDRILTRLRDLSLAIVRSPKAGLILVLKKTRELAEWVKTTLGKIGTAISARFAKIRLQMNRLFDAVKAPLVRFLETTKRHLNTLKAKLSALIGTVTAPMYVLFSKVIKLKDRCSQLISARLIAIKTLWRKVFAPIKLRLHSLFQLLSKPTEALKVVGHKGKAILIKGRAILNTVNMYARKLSWTTLRSTGQQVAEKAWVFLKDGGQKIVQTWNRLKLAQKLFPSWLRTIVSKYARKAVYGGQVFFALLRIFPKYIFKIMGELVVELKQRFP